MRQYEHDRRHIRNDFDILFSELNKMMVNKVIFVAYRSTPPVDSLVVLTTSLVNRFINPDQDRDLD